MKRIKSKGLLALSLTSFLTLTGCSSMEPHLEVVNREIVFEIKDKKAKVEVKDFLGEEADEHVLENTEMTSTFENADQVGTYDVALNYTTRLFKKKETEMVRVVVKDTKGPEFVDPKEEITVEQNAQDVDFGKYFTAKDNSEQEVKIYPESEGMDLSTLGQIELVMVAADVNGNETKHKVKVNIVDKSKTKDLTSYVEDRTIPVSETTELEIVKGNKTLVGAVGTNGSVIEKGKATSERTQGTYETWKKDEEAKRKAEEEKKRKEEEAKRKAEEAKEAERQRREQQAKQNSSTQNYQQPTYTQPTTSNSGSQTNNSSTGSKPQTVTKPQVQEPVCEVPTGNVFTNYQEALNWGDDYQMEHCGTVNGFRIATQWVCDTGYYIVSFY